MLQDPSCGWKTPRNTLIAICFSESVRRRVCCVCVCVCVHGAKGEIQDGQ